MSYRARDDGDIVPGSCWARRDGRGYATVKSVASGYVDYYRDDGTLDAAHHAIFRREHLAPYDAREIRSKFSMYLANLSHFHAYFAAGHIFARSSVRPPAEAYTAARGSPALPRAAIYVGTYQDPIKPDAFLADLNDALATLGTADLAA